MANIIYARVMQKTATLSEWMSSDLVLLDGEQAFVVSGDGSPINFKIGDGTKTFSELPFWIQYDQAQYISVEGTSLPTPSQDAGYSLVGSGTYTKAGQADVVVPSGHMGILNWDGSEWYLGSSVEMPEQVADGQIAEGDERAVSGDTAYLTLSRFLTIGDKELLQTELYGGDGTFTTSGSYRLSQNWISTRLIPINEAGATLIIKGFQDTTLELSVLLYKEDDELNQDPEFIPYNQNNDNEVEVDLPSGYSKLIIRVARGSGISSEIDSYEQSFTAYIMTSEDEINTSLIKDRIDSDQLKDIESDISDLKNNTKANHYTGLGHPTYEKGDEGDLYTDLISGRLFIKGKEKWSVNEVNGSYRVDLPEPMGILEDYKISMMRSGKAYIEWDGLYEEKVRKDYERLSKYYVSTKGSDSNEGTSKDSPLLTIEKALELGARNIIMEPGNYSINKGWTDNLVDNGGSEPLIIRCTEGTANIVRAYMGDEFSWAEQDGVYRATRSGVLSVVDFKFVNPYGLPDVVEKADSLEDCKEIKGSFFVSGNTVYINTLDGREPDSEVALTFSRSFSITSEGDSPYIYLENIMLINCHASSSLMIKSNEAVQSSTNVYLKNVRAHGNVLGDGIAIDNMKEAILEGCSSSYVLRDTFNYHTSKLDLGFEPMKVLEIDCYGERTGYDFDGVYSSNGSTIHEGGSILRLNSEYSKASGSAIADVNDGVRSINICVKASQNTLSSTFRAHGDDAKMWLINCVAYSDYDDVGSVDGQSGAVLYYDKDSKLYNDIRGNSVEI